MFKQPEENKKANSEPKKNAQAPSPAPKKAAAPEKKPAAATKPVSSSPKPQVQQEEAKTFELIDRSQLSAYDWYQNAAHVFMAYKIKRGG